MSTNKDHFGFSVGSEIPLNKVYKETEQELDSLVRKRSNWAIFLINVVLIFILANVFATIQFSSSKERILPNQDFIRGNIVDRNGDILATNLITKNLYCNSTKILSPEHTAKELTKIFSNLKYSEVYRKLTNGKSFTYIQKKLTPQEVHKIKLIGDPGLEFEDSQERVYPQGALTAHVIGMVDSNNNGVYGMEQMFNEELKGTNATVKVSIDSRIQNLMYKVLKSAQEKYEAIGAAGLLMNPNTGEIIAMISLPSFDPKDIGKYPDYNKFNKITQGVYELGSVFKLFNTAAALEFGIPENKKYEVWVPIKIGRFTVKDNHKMEQQYADMGLILAKSSNIGSVHMVEDMGIDFQKNFLTKLNLLDSVKTKMKPVAPPMTPKTWTKASSSSVSYGYNISVSPFQYLTSMNALVNGGYYIHPRFMPPEMGKPIDGRQVLSPEVSTKMRGYMSRVMLDGSGQYSRVRGINIGGKTGTAEKLVGGKYERRKIIAVFASAFPIENPQYSLFIMFDEPREKAGVYGRTAASNAAPVSKEIIESIYHLLDL